MSETLIPAQGPAHRKVGRLRYIGTWTERCARHPDHEGIVTYSMVQERMQEEIDDLREVYDCARTLVAVRGRFNTEQAFNRLKECLSINPTIGEQHDN